MPDHFKRWLYLKHFIFISVNIILFTLFISGHHLIQFDGSFWHFFSRLHPLINHFTVGALLLFPLLYKFMDWENVNIFFHISLLFLDLSFFSGLSLELIVKYPNETIQTHALWAATLYFLSYVIAFTPQQTWFKRICLASLLVLIIQTAQLGGTIYKGSNFYQFFTNSY